MYIIGRTAAKINKVAETYSQGISGRIIPVQGDVADKASIKAIVDHIASKESHVDILVNNAGISSNTVTPEAKSAEEMSQNLFHADANSFDDWIETFKINVANIYFMSAAFIPLLQAASEHTPGWSGTIVNTTSISGIVKTAQNHFAYNASKSAANHLTKMLAAEIAGNGLKIRVNAIAPGVFPSEMTANESNDSQKSELPKDKFEGMVPAKRPGRDRDMGSAMLFVITNTYVNGQVVPVDGGFIIQAGAA